MKKALATEGVEWAAAEMQFMQDGYISRILGLTKRYSGSAGVLNGGVVSSAGGLNIAISGPLEFVANGELGIITSPANQVLANNQTNYVIAQYGETDDTPATYYGTGAAPNLHRNETPSIIVRTTGAANLGVNEIDLATVVTAAGAISTNTDTRIVAPTVSAGNILLGSGKTIDGVDPSAHVALVATNAVLGHVLLGASGGAARFEDVPASAKYWIVDQYVSGRSNGFIPDDSDFTSPPGGVTVTTWRDLTYDGSHMREGSGPEYNWRLTLNFTSSAAFTATARILANDDTVRVKLNGSTIFSRSTPSSNLDLSLNLPVTLGVNTLKLFFCNGGGNEWRNQFFTSLLLDNRITFNPL